MGRDGDNFLERFTRFTELTDTRLRKVEEGQAAAKQEMVSLKRDCCDKRGKEIQELFNSRNELQLTVKGLTGSANGLVELCAGLDNTITELDRKALLLGEGEKGVLKQLKDIVKWNVPMRLQALETKVSSIEAEKTEKRQDTKDYKLLVYGALLGLLCTAAAGLLVFYITAT